MKTTKVSRTFTSRYDILTDVIVSPTRLEILNKLFDSPPEGLSYDELAKQMSKEAAGIQENLDVLVRDKMVEYNNKSRKYTLSKHGLDVYYDLGKAALKVKEEGLLDSPKWSNFSP